MRKTVIAAAVAALALTGTAAVAATAATGSFEAPAADWLFVQNADAVTFDGATLTLKGIHPQTVMFADRPQRMSGDMATEKFVSIWNEGKESFQKDPPNASISVVVGGKEQTAVVELTNPKLDGDTLSYSARVLDGSVPPQGGFASLFVDWWAGPWGGVCHYGPWGGVRCWQP